MDSEASTSNLLENRADINADLGLGRAVAERSERRFLNKDGSFNTRRVGLNFWASLNTYNFFLTLSWPAFFASLMLAYLGVNLLFAFLYLLCGPGALEGSSKGVLANGFWRAFFFSVETFSTIGFGNVSPVTLWANFLVTLEAFVGLLGVALATGLLFARFAKPTARVFYSQNALIAPYQGQTGLMCRAINAQRNELIELEAQISFSRYEWAGGKHVRRFYNLKLERNYVALFPLAWTLVHPIDEQSPLWGVTEQELLESDAEFLVGLKALEDTQYQVVYARTSYKATEVVWQAKFQDMYLDHPHVIAVDVRKLSLYDKL